MSCQLPSHFQSSIRCVNFLFSWKARLPKRGKLLDGKQGLSYFWQTELSHNLISYYVYIDSIEQLVEAVKSVSKMCEIKSVCLCVQYVQTDKEKIWFNEILVKLKMKETQVEMVSGNLTDNK